MTYTLRDTPEKKQGLIDLLEWTAVESPRILEVGSYTGESTEIFLDNGASAITCVDPWDPIITNGYTGFGEERLFDQRVGHDPRVTKVKAVSVSEARNRLECSSFDIVYIDACHDADCVCRDLLDVFHILRDRPRFISGHDYCNEFPGVIYAVSRIMNKVPDMLFCDTSWAFDMAKSSDNTIS